MSSTLPLLLLLAGRLAGAEPSPEDATQKVRLQVTTRATPESAHIRAETTWLGEQRSLDLTDDGQLSWDVPDDGIWAGEWVGAPVRALPISLFVSTAQQPEERVYDALEAIAPGEDLLTFTLELHARPPVRRIAATWPTRSPEGQETAAIAAAAGWAVLVLVYVLWLTGRSRSHGEDP